MEGRYVIGPTQTFRNVQGTEIENRTLVLDTEDADHPKWLSDQQLAELERAERPDAPEE